MMMLYFFFSSSRKQFKSQVKLCKKLYFFRSMCRTIATTTTTTSTNDDRQWLLFSPAASIFQQNNTLCEQLNVWRPYWFCVSSVSISRWFSHIIIIIVVFVVVAVVVVFTSLCCCCCCFISAHTLTYTHSYTTLRMYKMWCVIHTLTHSVYVLIENVIDWGRYGLCGYFTHLELEYTTQIAMLATLEIELSFIRLDIWWTLTFIFNSFEFCPPCPTITLFALLVVLNSYKWTLEYFIYIKEYWTD